MVTVQVVSQDSGKPEYNQKVWISRESTGILDAGAVTKTESTDRNGEAHFDLDPCNGTVMVNSEEKYKGRIAGRVVIYI